MSAITRLWLGLALLTWPGVVSAQRTARARVSVAVAAPAVAPSVLARAVALAAEDSLRASRRLLGGSGGVRITAGPPPRRARADDASPVERVRRVTVVYAAN